MEKDDIAQKELNLNIKHQLSDKGFKTFTQVGYEFEKGKYVFLLIIPKKLLGFK